MNARPLRGGLLWLLVSVRGISLMTSPIFARRVFGVRRYDKTFQYLIFNIPPVLSQSKSIDLSTTTTSYESKLPLDVCDRCKLTQIKFETLVAFFVLVLGCALSTPKLRRISWTSRVRETYVIHVPVQSVLTCSEIDVVDARSNFASVYHRGSWLFSPRE